MMMSGGGAAVLIGIVMLTLVTAIALIALWYAPDVWRLVRDTITRRDLSAESESDRAMEGRLLTKKFDSSNDADRDLRNDAE